MPSTIKPTLLTATLLLSAVAVGFGVNMLLLPLEGASAAHFEKAVMTLGAFQAVVLVLVGIATALTLRSVLRTKHNPTARTRVDEGRRQGILSTVSEGLFLLDEHGEIGTEVSRATSRIFREDNLPGTSLFSLLQKIVTPSTLDIAQDFVGLLWRERVNEKLVQDLNPLDEIEVTFLDESGEVETNFLSFDFSRVRANGKITNLLVTVTDITAQVQLARALKASHAHAQGQIDLLLGVLSVEPETLGQFLTETNNAVRTMRAIIRQPANDGATRGKKLNRLFREVHKVSGEAAALGLHTLERRTYVVEDALQKLREQKHIRNRDFQALIPTLEEIPRHLEHVYSLIGRLSRMHDEQHGRRPPLREGVEADEVARAEVTASLSHAAAVVLRTAESTRTMQASDAAVHSTRALPAALESLAKQITQETGKSAKVVTKGLDRIPNEYASAVKDMTFQLIRNALVHGIEAPSERSASDKEPTGTVVIEFRHRRDGRYELRCSDNGRGLELGLLRRTAVENGLVTELEARELGEQDLLSLILRPGFSTASADGPHRARGVGLDIVKTIVKRLHGEVRVNNESGKGAMFRIFLPSTEPLGVVTA